MSKSKVILLNGFAGSGKTTISKMYIDYHPLAMVIEGDELIVNIGDWLNREDQARDLVFKITKEILKVAIDSGNNVILPYLVTNTEHIEELEKITINNGSQFYEFCLSSGKDSAIQRLMKRGTWGEAGSPPITEADIPFITHLYELMESKFQDRPRQVFIDVEEGSPDKTYQKLVQYLDRLADTTHA
jgi:adenylylsulfate kinase-like enzyme